MSQMFRAVAAVQAEILKGHNGNEPLRLQNIIAAVKGITAVDHFIFVQFQASAENPIWGEFTRWNRRPGVYEPLDTMVEVRYAAHLTIPWRRFVVCKEICHALDEFDGSCASVAAIDGVVNAFAIASQNPKARGHTIAKAVPAELNAEAGAIELLLPMPIRKKLLAKGQLDFAKIADQYEIPIDGLEPTFDTGYMELVDELFQGQQ